MIAQRTDDRRMDYYTKDTKSTKSFIADLRDLRGFKISTDETSDRQNLIAGSKTNRLYSTPCCLASETSGTKNLHDSRRTRANPMVNHARRLRDFSRSIIRERRQDEHWNTASARLQYAQQAVACTRKVASIGASNKIGDVLGRWACQ